MAALAAMRNKPPPLNPDERLPNSYAMAVEFPMEPDRLFDGELNLLLMDGLVVETSRFPPLYLLHFGEF